MEGSSGYIRNLISRRLSHSSASFKDVEGSILIVGEETPDHRALAKILRSVGHVVDHATLDEAVPLVQKDEYDILIVDIEQMEQALKMVSAQGRASVRPKLVALLETHSPEKVVEMMKLGVGDCIPRPLHRDYVLLVIKRSMEYLQLVRRAEEGERYKRLSKLDGLTELCNHRHFHELLSSEIERAMRDHAPLTVLMIDVDKFKAYNDTNGHLAGDAALKQIASILSASVRSYDIVARYGGEEFALMLPGTDLERGMIVAQRLVERIEAASFPHEESLPEGRLTVSIGASSFPSYGRDKDTLINGADTAMYAAKAQGGNAVRAAKKEGLLQAQVG